MDEFFRHFRSFLGIPRSDSHRYHHEEERQPNDLIESRYDAFSDPMEMHKYFEQQMNKILRNFDIFEFGNSESFFSEVPSYGAIEFFDELPHPNYSSENGELRDLFLKPGYEQPSEKHLMDKSDKDLDESKISIGDLDSVVTGKYFKKKLVEQPNVTTRFMGKSVSTKTVMNADGSVEIHKIVRDNEGNEETTITRKIGNKEHSIVKKKDSTGKEEVTENFINMDETDSNISLFLNDPTQSGPWSLFDKFFK